MATKAQLRRLVLAELKVIAAVTTAPTAEIGALCDLYIDGGRAELLEKGLCWWDEDSIPDAVSVPLAKYIASQACAGFGKDGKGHEAKERPALKKIAALKSTAQRETVRAEYF